MANKKKKGFRLKSRQQHCSSTKVSNRSAVRKQWSDVQMEGALENVIKDGLSQNRAADLHGVPRSTLKDRLSGRVVHGTNPGPQSYLSSSEELELAAFLVDAAKMGYGRTSPRSSDEQFLKCRMCAGTERQRKEKARGS